MQKTLGQLYAEELMAEVEATRKCIERVPESMWQFKATEKAMGMGHMILTIAGIPAWITHVIEKGDIDFSTYQLERPATTADMVKYFDANIAAAKKALENASDEEFDKSFSLKNKGQVLSTNNKKETVSSTINHMVHHRGQLTIYMRLNNISVPSIYGPSGDEKQW